MKVITFAHQKGGVGKTTLSLNVTHTLTKLGYKVALIDTDRQGSTYKFGKNFTQLDVFVLNDEKDSFDFSSLSGNYDFAIIDTPPYNTSIYKDIFAESDLIIIPSSPSPADVIEVRTTTGIVRSAMNEAKKMYGTNLQAYIVINRQISTSTLLKEVQNEFDLIKEQEGISSFDTTIENRVELPRSLVLPEGIYSTSDKKAQSEFTNLTNEILKALENE